VQWRWRRGNRRRPLLPHRVQLRPSGALRPIQEGQLARRRRQSLAGGLDPAREDNLWAGARCWRRRGGVLGMTRNQRRPPISCSRDAAAHLPPAAVPALPGRRRVCLGLRRNYCLLSLCLSGELSGAAARCPLATPGLGQPGKYPYTQAGPCPRQLLVAVRAGPLPAVRPSDRPMCANHLAWDASKACGCLV